MFSKIFSQPLTKSLFYMVAAFIGLAACDMQDNEIAPETSFTAIYNNEQFTEASIR